MSRRGVGDLVAARVRRMHATPVRPARSWLGGSRRFTQSIGGGDVTYGSGYHTPVMVREVLNYLAPARGGLFLDGTLGGGGHSHALLDASDGTQVIGVDRDPDALAEAEGRLRAYGERFRSVRSTFARSLDAAGIGAGQLDGALLDLGVSSHQIDAADRGFTFRSGAPLDMRMEGSAGERTAAELLNELPAEELATIFYRYGEERRSRHLARIVVEMREDSPFERSEQLVEAIDRALPRAEPQDRARIFQALRIAVNGEMQELEAALPVLRDALAPGGVLVVISYHSLEDRLVKDAFREWSRSCVCPPGLPVCVCRGAPLGTLLTRKPVMAGGAEVAANPRARSARLRAWRKT